MGAAEAEAPAGQRRRLSALAVAALALVALSVVFVAVFVPTWLVTTRKQHEAAALLQEPAPCTAMPLPAKEVKPPAWPAVSGRPNFIYLLLDDLGYDDVGLHHPPGSAVRTPNIDRLLREGTEFTNFYTTPMCTMSRAELLTGRYYPRTGSMYINTGWDFMSTNETTIAEVMSKAGYKTAHFGKWHNGRTAGYQPWNVGFRKSVVPTAHIHRDAVFVMNGKPVPTKGWMERVLMGQAIDYLKRRKQDGQPFFMFYPSYSVHAGWMTSKFEGPRYQRPAPPEYFARYSGLGLANSTAQLYAMLEHMDDQVGRLLDYLDDSGLSANTYVMLSGDNGAALFGDETTAAALKARMPSRMQGAKRQVKEGGIRNLLVVRGPGVAQGASNDALLGLIDVLPTVVELSGMRQVQQHRKWDGLSFANLVRSKAATRQQQERLLFFMQSACIEDDFLPRVSDDDARLVLKPQPLLNYLDGGAGGLGFKRCMAVRYRDYKWLADPSSTGSGIKGKASKAGNTTAATKHGVRSRKVKPALYKFRDGNHIELRCQEVTESEPATAAQLQAAAAAWFADMLASPASFTRPLFFLGLDGRPSTNMVADGATAVSPGVRVLPMGLSGFRQPGDSAWYRVKVERPGSYEVALAYQSRDAATFKLSVGTHSAIAAGTAAHVQAELSPSPKKRTLHTFGELQLQQTPPGETWEVQLQLIGSSRPGEPAIAALDNIVFSLKGAPGALPYNPNDGEGVQVWKLSHGYAHIQGGRH